VYVSYSKKDANSNDESEQSEFKRTMSSDDSTDSADDEVRRLFKVYDVIRDEENEKRCLKYCILQLHLIKVNIF
jgi:hypothetical protein